MVGHELCHGTVAQCLRPEWARQTAIHALTLPSVGSAIFEYYAHFHLGHHAVLGSRASVYGDDLGARLV